MVRYQYKQPENEGLKLIVAGIIGALIIIAILLALRIEQETKFKPNLTQPTEITNLTPIQTEVSVVAVTSDGQGIIGKATIELIPGRGRVLIATNPFIEPDTQFSVEIAKDVAANFTGKYLDKFDTIISFDISDNGEVAGVIGGPSAGAALALAIVATTEGTQVSLDVAITGTIESDGRIGPVGGVIEKAEAAAKAGKKLFLVPKGQGSTTYYEKEVVRETAGNFEIQRIRYVPRTVELGNYTGQWGMNVIEVTNIREAAVLAIPDLPLRLKG